MKLKFGKVNKSLTKVKNNAIDRIRYRTGKSFNKISDDYVNPSPPVSLKTPLHKFKKDPIIQAILSKTLTACTCLQKGLEIIQCPSCDKIWHVICLEKRYKSNSLVTCCPCC